MTEDIKPGSKEFEKPVFNPNIPSHLLKSCNDQQRFILERISVLTQQQAWQIQKVGETHNYCKAINGKVIELEKFRQAELTRLAVSDGSKKWKRWLGIICVVMIYPIYLTAIENTGLLDMLKFVW